MQSPASEEKTPLEKILSELPIESEEIVSWLQQPVTQVFFECVKIEQKACDEEVHFCLGTQSNDDALQANGGFKTCERILEIPQDIIDHLKENRSDDS